PDSYVKFKKNGTWVTYTALGELGPDLADASKTNFGVSATSNDQDVSFDISIQVDGNNFATGVYNSDNTSYWTVIGLFTGFKTGDMQHYDITEAPGRAPSQYQVTVTSITANELQGTFTGNYLYNYFGNGTSADVVEITEGSFKVKRVR
ncbi:MAG TPA: hypothetical protein VM012_13820, partial [Flavitalea sp.]|nr:hypothetical protein [Flavitalea sp.]